MCGRSCGWNYSIGSSASERWDEGTHHWTWGTQYSYPGNHDWCRADYWWYSGSGSIIRIWSHPSWGGQNCSGAFDCGRTDSSGQNRRDGRKGTAGSGIKYAWGWRGSYPWGRYPRHSSRACEASWQDEVQNQLWSECTEAFHGGCAAGRPSGIWGRRGCSYGKTRRFITWHW